MQLAWRILRGDARSRMSAVFTAVGVAVGVTLVLWLAAVPGALQSRAEREAWRYDSSGLVEEGDTRAAVVVGRSRDGVAGQEIQRFDVAGLKPGAPVAPGIGKLPGPGQVLLSPALAELAAQLPADRLADRFRGTVIGRIGPEALSNPDELVAIVGHTPDELPGRTHRSGLVGTPGMASVDETLVLLTRIGLIVLVAPCLVLVASAARLTAARRERRLAALRLAGATPRQVVWTTAAETAIAAVVGTVLGLVLTVPLRSLTAQVPWDGGTWFPPDLTPPLGLVVAVGLGAPLLVVAAAALGLRRAIAQPLGAAQQQSRRQPSALRLLWLVGAGVVFVVGLNMAGGQNGTLTGVLFGLAAVAVALVFTGPLVTSLIGRFFTKRWGSASTLLAGRRLSDDPRAAFRASSGVVLAVFTGSMALAMFPGLESQIGYSDGKWRDGVFVARSYDVTDKQVEALRADISARDVDASVVRVVEGGATTSGDRANEYEALAVSCADAGKVFGGDVGTCQGGPAVYLPRSTAVDVNRLRFTSADGVSIPLPADVSVREYRPADGTSGILVDPALLPGIEQARGTIAVVSGPAHRDVVHTLLVRNLPGIYLYSNEQYDARGDVLMGDLRRATVIGLAIAAVLGGVSAAVASAGSVVDRRRTFGALIASGTPVAVLARALRREAMLPAIVATLGAGVAGVLVGSGLLTLVKGEFTLHPWLVTPVVLGLVVALLAASACGPVLRRVTARSYTEE